MHYPLALFGTFSLCVLFIPFKSIFYSSQIQRSSKNVSNTPHGCVFVWNYRRMRKWMKRESTSILIYLAVVLISWCHFCANSHYTAVNKWVSKQKCENLPAAVMRASRQLFLLRQWRGNRDIWNGDIVARKLVLCYCIKDHCMYHTKGYKKIILYFYEWLEGQNSEF